ncbi:MAG: transposase [Bdellovibrionales bacterium]|nr:transposase [Bdellovibrionales bacterium]
MAKNTAKSSLKRSRHPQLTLLKKQKSAYGGELRNTRAGRAGARPLAVKQTMHLVLRSSKAKGAWSFRHARNARRIQEIIHHFAGKNGVFILSMANVGNHLHIHMKLMNRFTYAPFIRAITSAIAMAVTGRSRWRKPTAQTKNEKKESFWDYRPFTRVIESFRALLTMRDYVRINQLEGCGVTRAEARSMIYTDTFRIKTLRAERDGPQ